MGEGRKGMKGGRGVSKRGVIDGTRNRVGNKKRCSGCPARIVVSLPPALLAGGLPSPWLTPELAGAVQAANKTRSQQPRDPQERKLATDLSRPVSPHHCTDTAVHEQATHRPESCASLSSCCMALRRLRRRNALTSGSLVGLQGEVGGERGGK